MVGRKHLGMGGEGGWRGKFLQVCFLGNFNEGLACAPTSLRPPLPCTSPPSSTPPEAVLIPEILCRTSFESAAASHCGVVAGVKRMTWRDCSIEAGETRGRGTRQEGRGDSCI